MSLNNYACICIHMFADNEAKKQFVLIRMYLKRIQVERNLG